MKRLRAFILMICLIVPFFALGCEKDNKNQLATPTELNVNTGGLISFQRISDADYYVIEINDYSINVFTNSNNVELYSESGKSYLTYNASKNLILGEGYNIRIKACADGKKDSRYASTTYIHTIPMTKATNIKINGTNLTWDVVENASFYLVKVIRPADDIKYDDSESIASLDLPTYQFSTNKFDFESILSMAGEYKFYINSVSYNAKYTDSGFTSHIAYRNKVQLEVPQNSIIHKVSEYSSEKNQFVDNLHLVTVIDINSNAFTVHSGDFSKTIELNISSNIFTLNNNILDVNLNLLFKSVEVEGQYLNFDNVGQYAFTISSGYVTFNEQDKFYIDSNISDEIVYDNVKKLNAPTINLSYDNLNENYIVSWQAKESELDYVSGYALYVTTESGLVKYTYSNTILSKILTSDFIGVSVQVLGKGNYALSDISEQLSSKIIEIQTELNVQTFSQYISWNDVNADYYLIQVENEIFETTETIFDIMLLSTEPGSKLATITAIKQGYKPLSFEFELSYSKKLATPYIGYGQGFADSNGYVLTFTGVDNAFGYYVYLKGKDNSEAVMIQQLFTTTTIDLSKYIIKQGEYKDYKIQIQAVAYKYSGFLDSNLTDENLLTVSHTKTLDAPQFAKNENNQNNPILKKMSGTNVLYYLRFYGVSYAYKYEIMVNFNTINVMSNGTTDLYEIDITKYLTSANSYTIMLRALPNPEGSENVKASAYNIYDYTLTLQLDEVTNIRVAENEGIYTLSFDLQDNAAYYSVRIVKSKDSSYSEFLYTLGLNNPFDVVQSTDITAYLSQEGEYYIYITAIAAKNGYYGDSDESKEYATVNKLETLKLPTNLAFNNVSKDEYYIRFDGDSNADYYIIKATDPNEQSKEYSVYNATEFNINSIFTIEGSYKFSVKAMINPKSDNSIKYNSSSYCDEVYINYIYTQMHDFERHGIFMYGNSYDFLIRNIEQLEHVLWYHYLYDIDSTYKLSMYVYTEEYESVKDAIVTLASEATTRRIHNFANDEIWLSLVNSQASDGQLFSHLAKELLKQYPELSVLSNFTYSNTSNIFRLYYENSLDVDKVEAGENFTTFATDYANDYNYLDIYSRRNKNNLFAIDSYSSINVTTTEQLLMAVGYGKLPNFVGDSRIAQLVYANAKAILLSIINNSMTELEKVTAIFDWISYAANLNYSAGKVMSETIIVDGELSDYGNRIDYYLEGILLNLANIDAGSYDEEFYLGKISATSEAYAKVFILLCGIEGITAIKVNGTHTYTLYGDTINVNHSWNKVYLDVSSDNSGKDWYALDLTYSDNYFVPYNTTANFGMASHLYFLVSDSHLKNNLNLEESRAYMDTPICTSNYDYYANSAFGMTTSQILSIIGESGIGEATYFNYAKEYIINSSDYYQLYAKSATSGYNQLQAFVFNALLYAKYNQKNNSTTTSVFEMKFSFEALGSEYLPSNSSINTILATFNQYYLTTAERVQASAISFYDSTNKTTVYVFTLKPQN